MRSIAFPRAPCPHCRSMFSIPRLNKPAMPGYHHNSKCKGLIFFLPKVCCNDKPVVFAALTMYSMLEAGGWTWPRSLLCRSRMRCMSPSLMALLPLGLALHHSSSWSRNLSRMDSSRVELVRTMARAVWVRHRYKLAALTQPRKGRGLFMTVTLLRNGEHFLVVCKTRENRCRGGIAYRF